MPDQIFYPAKGKMLYIGIFFSILLVFAGGYNFFIKNSRDIFSLLPGILGLFFLVLNLKPLLVGTKDGLYINAQGITIKVSYVSHFIEWQNIKSFRSFEIMKQPMIAINLFDNDKFLSKKKGIFKKMGETALKRHGAPLSIAVKLYNISSLELLNILNQQLDKWR